MNWIVVVSLIGAAQGFFIAYLVLAHARQKRANLWLGLYVLAYSALCLDDATNNSVLVLRYPDLAALFAFCILLLGPFLYQYVRTLTRRKPLGKLFLLHLAPALVMFLIFSLFHFLPMQQKRDLVSSAKAMEGRPSLDPTLAVAALQTLAYLTASVLMLRTYARELKQSYSSIDRLAFVWLRNLLLINCVLWFVWIAAVVTHRQLASVLDYVGFPVMAYVLAAFALRSPEVLVSSDEGATSAPIASAVQQELPQLPNPIEPDHQPLTDARCEGTVLPRYQKSRLPEAILARYQRKLTALMAQEKAYLETELTLTQLAGKLGISNHHLSQVLNERLGLTFFDYVNQLRVEEVKRLLRDPKRAGQSILDLAFEAGFSAKSSFNAIFKRSTGQSPTAYRRLSPSVLKSHESPTSEPLGPDDSFRTSA